MYTLEQLGKIVADVKSSWYFRVWGLVWLGLAIAFLVGFAFYQGEAGSSKKDPIWRMRVNDYSKHGIEFPSFEIRVVDTTAVSFVGEVNCGHNIKPIRCFKEFGMDKCQIVSASVVTGTPGKAELDCTYAVNTTSADSNLMVSIILSEGAEPIYVAPNNAAYLMIQKVGYEPASKDKVEHWDATLVYQSSVQTTTTNLKIQIVKFWVEEYQQYHFYNGWMSAADIGGFGFLCSLILTGVMMCAGLGLGNDSQFLGGAKSRNDNSPIY